MMTTRKYEVRFVTPAFLGDFEQGALARVSGIARNGPEPPLEPI